MSEVIGWARVSSEAQSLQGQLEALKQAKCGKVFQSKHSGKANGKNIDKLDDLVSFAREGDTVVVTKLDRLGRSLSEVLQTVDRLRSKGVALKALDQPIDTSKDDAFSNAMLQLMGVFAEMERAFIRDRTQAGKERTGNYGGRKKTISVSDREQIRTDVANGITQYSLAKKFKVSATTINRIVKNK